MFQGTFLLIVMVVFRGGYLSQPGEFICQLGRRMNQDRQVLGADRQFLPLKHKRQEWDLVAVAFTIQTIISSRGHEFTSM